MLSKLRNLRNSVRRPLSEGLRAPQRLLGRARLARARGIFQQKNIRASREGCRAQEFRKNNASLQFSSQKGATLAEMLIVLAIAAILFVLVYNVFVNYNRGQALEKSSAGVAAILNEARSKTLAGRGAAQYGVHFASDHVTFFTGAAYNPSAPNNKTEYLNSLAEISAIALNGGGSNTIFEKLTGATNQYGTITVRNKNNPALTMTVTIYQTGLIETK